MKKRKAFTMIELLVTIAIVSVLATVGVIAYSSAMKKAYLSNDEAIVSQLNDYMTAYEMIDDVKTTSHAREVLIDDGIKLETLYTDSENYHFAYDIVNKKFCLFDSEYITEYEANNSKDVFIFVKDIEELKVVAENGYSAYLQENFDFGFDEDSFDASSFNGDCVIDTGVNAINNFEYINKLAEDEGYNKVFYVNTEIASVDAAYDTIGHYGKINTSLDIKAVDSESYTEYGQVMGNVFIGQGHFIVGEGARVSYIIVTGEGEVILDGITDEQFIVVYGGAMVQINKSGITYANHKDGAENVSGEHIIYMVDEDGEFIEYNASDINIIAMHYFEGLGTKEHPFIIKEGQDYVRLQDFINEYYDQDLSDLYFKQIDDIVVDETIVIDKNNKIHIDVDGHTITIDKDSDLGGNVDNEYIIVEDQPEDTSHTHTWQYVNVLKHYCSTCKKYETHRAEGKCKCGLITVKKLSEIETNKTYNKSGSKDAIQRYRLASSVEETTLTIDENYIEIILTGKTTTFSGKLNITGSNVTISGSYYVSASNYVDYSTFNFSNSNTGVNVTGQNVEFVDVKINKDLTVGPNAKLTISGPEAEVIGDINVDPTGELIIEGGSYQEDPTDYLAKGKKARRDGISKWTVVDEDDYIYPVYVEDNKKEYASLEEALKAVPNAKNIQIRDLCFYSGTLSSDTTYKYDGTQFTAKNYGTIKDINGVNNRSIKLVTYGSSLIKQGKFGVKLDLQGTSKIDCTMSIVDECVHNNIWIQEVTGTSEYKTNLVAALNGTGCYLRYVDGYYNVTRKAVAVTVSGNTTYYDSFADAYASKGVDGATFVISCDQEFDKNIDKNITVKSYSDTTLSSDYTLTIKGEAIISKGTYDVEVKNITADKKFIQGGNYAYDPTAYVDLSLYYYSAIKGEDEAKYWTVSFAKAQLNGKGVKDFETAYNSAKDGDVITLNANDTFRGSETTYIESSSDGYDTVKVTEMNKNVTVKSLTGNNFTLEIKANNLEITNGTYDVTLINNADSDGKWIVGGKFKQHPEELNGKDVLLGDCFSRYENGYYVVINTVLSTKLPAVSEESGDIFENAVYYFAHSSGTKYTGSCTGYANFDEAYKKLYSGSAYKYNLILLYDVHSNSSIDAYCVVWGNVAMSEGKYTLRLNENAKISNGVMMCKVGTAIDSEGKLVNSTAVTAGKYLYDPTKFVDMTKYTVHSPCIIQLLGLNKGYVVSDGNYILKNANGYQCAYKYFSDAYDYALDGGEIIIYEDATVDSYNLTKNIKYTYGSGEDYIIYVTEGLTISNGQFDVNVDIGGVDLIGGIYNKEFFTAENIAKEVNENYISYLDGDYYKLTRAEASMNGRGYKSFTEAYNANNDNSEIKLLTNAKYDGIINKDIKVTGNYTLTVNGIESNNGIYDCQVIANSNSIKGGSYKYSVANYVEEYYYQADKNDEGYYKVNRTIAKLNNKAYNSFEDAYNDASDGNIIVLYHSGSFEGYYTKNITVNSYKDSKSWSLSIKGVIEPTAGTFNVNVKYSKDKDSDSIQGGKYLASVNNGSNDIPQNEAAWIHSKYCVGAEGNYYVVGEAYAQIGDKRYPSFASAYSDAEANATITLLRDSSYYQPITKNVLVNGAHEESKEIFGYSLWNWTQDIIGTKTEYYTLTIGGNVSAGAYNCQVSFVNNAKVSNGVFRYEVPTQNIALASCQVKDSDNDIYTVSAHEFTTKDNSQRKTQETCKVEGEYYYTCSKCGAKGESTYKVAKLAHNYTDTSKQTSTQLAQPATCSTNARYYYTCTMCGANGTSTYEKANSTIAHTFTNKERITSDYLASGRTCQNVATYYYSCAYCTAKGTATFEVGTVADHVYTDQDANAAYLKSEATCQNEAVYYCNCKWCDASAKGKDESKTFASGGTVDHDFSREVISDDYAVRSLYVVGEKQIVSCTSDGKYYHACKWCDKSSWSISNGGKIDVSTFEVKAYGHDWSTATVKSNATCTANKVMQHTCNRCGEYETWEVANTMLSHTYNQKNTDQKYLNTSATCSAKATYFYSCSCGAKGTETFESGNLASHNFTDTSKQTSTQLAQPATCSTNAKYYYTCTMCGANGTSTYEKANSTIAHTFTNQRTTSDYLATSATCQAKATYYYSCQYCTAKGTSTYEVGNVLSHNYTYDNITWDGITAKANYSCKNGCQGTASYNCKVKSETTSTPTCQDKGNIKYTATYEGHSDIKNVAIDKVSHSYTVKSSNVLYLKGVWKVEWDWFNSTTYYSYYYKCQWCDKSSRYDGGSYWHE